jgi:hypothetical protein
VTKRTLTGEEVWTLGYPHDSKEYERGPGKQGLNCRPTNIAAAPNGDIYVGDGYGSSYINQYDKNAKYIRTFGGPGQDPKAAGSLVTPHGLIVDERESQPTLLVADRGNNRIQRLTLDGKHIEFIGGTVEPCHFHERNGLMVAPDLTNRTTLLGRDNKVIARLGDSGYSNEKRNEMRLSEDGSKFEPGKFICPHAAIFDHNGVCRDRPRHQTAQALNRATCKKQRRVTKAKPPSVARHVAFYSRANTKMLLAMLGRSSRASPFSANVTNPAPVLTATYCFPPAE